MKKLTAMLLSVLMLALPVAADEAAEAVVTSVEEEVAVEVVEETPAEEAVEETAEDTSIFKLYVLDASDNTILGYIDETSNFMFITATLFGIDNVALVVDELAEGYTIGYNGADLEVGVITEPIAVTALTSIDWTLSYAIDENGTMQYNNYIWLFGYPDNYVDVTAYTVVADSEPNAEVILTNEMAATAEDGTVLTPAAEIPEEASVYFYVTADSDVTVTINGVAANGYTEPVAVSETDEYVIEITVGEETKTFTYSLAEEESIHPISRHYLYGAVQKICG